MPKKTSSAGEKPVAVEAKSKNKRKTGKILLLLLVILLLLAAGGFFAYKYNEAKKDVERLSDPQQAAQDQTRQLIEDVGRLVELPSGETPTIATVSDVSKLQNQAFFAKAQNGDKVLIYTQAKRAVLYRPSTNKIIEVAPVNIGNNSSSDTTGSQEDQNSGEQ